METDNILLQGNEIRAPDCVVAGPSEPQIVLADGFAVGVQKIPLADRTGRTRGANNHLQAPAGAQRCASFICFDPATWLIYTCDFSQGIYVKGIYLENAGWDSERRCLKRAEVCSLSVALPVVQITATQCAPEPPAVRKLS
jgi:Dynein heavy chain C-terminal domain